MTLSTHIKRTPPTPFPRLHGLPQKLLAERAQLKNRLEETQQGLEQSRAELTVLTDRFRAEKQRCQQVVKMNSNPCHLYLFLIVLFVTLNLEDLTDAAGSHLGRSFSLHLLVCSSPSVHALLRLSFLFSSWTFALFLGSSSMNIGPLFVIFFFFYMLGALFPFSFSIRRPEPLSSSSFLFFCAFSCHLRPAAASLFPFA